MAGFELPDPQELYIGGEELDVDVYSDRISASWTAKVDYPGFIEACLQTPSIHPGSDALIETDEDSMKTSLGQGMEEIQGEPQYVTVYGSDYSLSWERIGSNSNRGRTFGEVGMVLEPSASRHLLEFFESTTGEEPSEDDVRKILELGNDVDS